MNRSYKVPTIPQNLSKQETIVQIAEVLNHLSNITDDVFDRVSKRIDAGGKKLAEIAGRVDKVNMKIEKLTGAKKATQVYSSAKYPAAELNKPYISIFTDVEAPEIVRHKVKYKNEVLNDEPLDKLNVYHVQVRKTNRDTIIVTGLGDMPSDIECLNDVLLYNSGRNIYKNFAMSDALDGSKQIREHELTDNSTIGAAPHSIVERASLTKSLTHSYLYTPTSEEIPVLDVPLDLPDLPNIADDLRYDIDLGPGIGPSAVAATNIPDEIPVVEPSSISAEDDENEIINVELPPPPPPLLVIKEAVKSEPEIEEEKPEIIEEIVETLKLPTEKPQPPKILELPQLDMRASLMDAIRNAGGAKNLKSAQKDPISQAKVHSSGDLMADLHAKLSMRRKGISGTKNPQVLDASSALEKISARIPPPALTNENNDNNTEDEDWDD